MKLVSMVLHDGTRTELVAREVKVTEIPSLKYVWVRYVGPGWNTPYVYEDGLGDLEVGDLVKAGMYQAPAVVVQNTTSRQGLRNGTLPITEKWTVADWRIGSHEALHRACSPGAGGGRLHRTVAEPECRNHLAMSDGWCLHRHIHRGQWPTHHSLVRERWSGSSVDW